MDSLKELDIQVRSIRRSLSIETGEAMSLARRGQELEQEVAALESARRAAERVSVVLSQIGSERDVEARAQVEQLVSSGLKAIFQEDLSFHLVESSTRQIPQIDFVVRTHHHDGSHLDTDVLAARGGGLAAVVGLLLRVVLILLTKASGRSAPGLLVLDETLAHLSSEYLDAAGQFLRTLCDSTGLQIIMVTHQSELVEYADIAYRFRLGSTGETVCVREK